MEERYDICNWRATWELTHKVNDLLEGRTRTPSQWLLRACALLSQMCRTLLAWAAQWATSPTTFTCQTQILNLGSSDMEIWQWQQKRGVFPGLNCLASFRASRRSKKLLNSERAREWMWTLSCREESCLKSISALWRSTRRRSFLRSSRRSLRMTSLCRIYGKM